MNYETTELYAYIFDLGPRGFKIVAHNVYKKDLPELKASRWVESGNEEYSCCLGVEHALHLKSLITSIPMPFRQGMALIFVIERGKILSIK